MYALIVKTSSLGDIVHTLPALTDATRALPQLRCDWLVERAFADIPTWHTGVQQCIACDLRGWRKHPGRTLFGGDWRRFTTTLRAHRYDVIVDAQGLLKSAWLARRATGPLAGPDLRSAREPLAALFYDRRYRIPGHAGAHAVDRMRQLFALAFDYPLPQTPPASGLEPARFPRPERSRPYAMFLHGTTWESKRWPLDAWQRLGADLRRRGIEVVIPWGSAAEQADAAAIAAACGGQVLPRLALTELAGWIAHARLCVGVDTGLAHLAAAFGVPQVTLYGPTLPELTGAVGDRQLWLRSTDATAIDRQRPNTVPVERVTAALDSLLEPAQP
jgi:heptosyltransferase-1